MGELHGAYPVFTTMMVPERLGTAAMTIGPARAALDVATHYTSKRRAFGAGHQPLPGREFPGGRGRDAARRQPLDGAHDGLRAPDKPVETDRLRRLVSETKKFVTESCQKVVHNAMQVCGGIGYTNVLPIERIHRDVRLASIWTGTNEVMSLIVAHEWYREAKAARWPGATSPTQPRRTRRTS